MKNIVTSIKYKINNKYKLINQKCFQGLNFETINASKTHVPLQNIRITKHRLRNKWI